MNGQPPRSPLFPYTTLFRSVRQLRVRELTTEGSPYPQIVVDALGVLVSANHPARQMFEIPPDRKSTRLNSSHRCISYAVFCLKKKNQHQVLDCLGGLQQGDT